MATPVDPNKTTMSGCLSHLVNIEDSSAKEAVLPPLSELLKIFPPLVPNHNMPFHIRFSHALTDEYVPQLLIFECQIATLEGYVFNTTYSYDLEQGQPKTLQSTTRTQVYYVSVFDRNNRPIVSRAKVRLRDHETLYIAIRDDCTYRLVVYGRITV